MNYSIIYYRYYVLGGLQFEVIAEQFGKTMIQAIRIEFPNLSNAIRQKIRLVSHEPSNMHQASTIVYRTSSVQRQVQLQASHIKHQGPSIKRHAASVKHQASSVKHQLSSIAKLNDHAIRQQSYSGIRRLSGNGCTWNAMDMKHQRADTNEFSIAHTTAKAHEKR